MSCKHQWSPTLLQVCTKCDELRAVRTPTPEQALREERDAYRLLAVRYGNAMLLTAAHIDGLVIEQLVQLRAQRDLPQKPKRRKSTRTAKRGR